MRKVKVDDTRRNGGEWEYLIRGKWVAYSVLKRFGIRVTC